MGRINEESVRRVKDAVDIVELINSYVPLQKAGSSWKACCPFHQEKTPSFNVHVHTQTFRCFGCGESGTAVDFVMKMENMSFSDTIRRLAERVGIPIIEEQSDPEADQRNRKRTQILLLNKKVKEFFHDVLVNSVSAQDAVEYLHSRGYDLGMAKRWQLGWAPGSSHEFFVWAKKQEIVPSVLQEAGLIKLSQEGKAYPVFKDRLMFPIHNAFGECVGFSGRQIPQRPQQSGKYVNTAETAVFKKGEILFALDKARAAMGRENKALLCEGQLDVIACHEAGFPIATAAQGTAFTPEHAKLLSRYAKRVVLSFDADTAGVKAADRAFKTLAPFGIDVFWLILPDGDDPDSFIKTQGKEAFAELLQHAQPFFEARMARTRDAGLLQTTIDKINFAREVADLLAYMQDHMARDVIMTDVATRLQIDKKSILRSVNRHRHQNAETGNRVAMRTITDEENTAQKNVLEQEYIKLSPTMAVLCDLALSQPDAQNLILDHIEELTEPMELLSGGNVLKKILAKLPDPSDSTAIHLFMEELSPAEQKACEDLGFSPKHFDNLALTIDEACGAVSREFARLYLTSVLAQLADPNLEVAKREDLLKKCVDLQKLLNTI